MSKLTKGTIVNSFWMLLKEKSLDKITVKDIIESAQINRNTFYYHYEDIYDLLDSVFREEAAKYRAERKEDISFYEEYVRAAALFLEHRAAIIHIYNSKSRDVINSNMKSAADDFVFRFVKKAAEKNISDEGLLYITGFYSCAIVGNTVSLIENGMQEYQTELLHTISDSFESTVDIMIQDYIEHHS